MSQQPKPHVPSPAAERAATVIETEEYLRKALPSARMEQLSTPRSPTPAPMDALGDAQPLMPATAPAVAARSASPFQPTVRPPIAFLTVFDDGKTEAEVIRIRENRFVIGRTEGELRIPIDGRISGRHVEITHQVVGGLHRLVVTDLHARPI